MAHSFLARASALLLAVALVLPASADRSKRPEKGPAKLSSKAKKALLKQIKAVFAAHEDRDKQAELVEQLRKLPPLNAKDAKYIAKMCIRYGRFYGFKIPKGSSFSFPFDGKQIPEVYVVGSGSSRKGLWIGLHGGGPGIGSGTNSRNNWRASSGTNCVCLFPTVDRPTKMSWSQPDAHRFVIGLLNAAIRTWNIDTNRVYVSGHSMGGYGTWSIGTAHADRFAALIVGAGGGYGNGVPTNLYNTPIYTYHGTNDTRVPPGSARGNAADLKRLQKKHPRGYIYEFHEYPKIGHGFPPTGLNPPVKWAAKHTRKPYPKKLIWHANQEFESYKHRFGWLYMPNKPSRYGMLVAEWTDRSTLQIKAKYGAGGLTVLLSPELCDFAKPITVKVNDEVVHTGQPAYDVWTIVRTTVYRSDAKQFFMGHVTLKGELPDERTTEDDDVTDEDDEDDEDED